MNASKSVTKLLILSALLYLGLWRDAGHVALAQEDGIAIHIQWPNAGETLYAAPTSLLYSVPIRGHVESAAPLPEGAELTLEVVRDGELLGTLSQPLHRGAFEFLVTVNPQGSDGNFPSEHLTCGYDCHLPGNLDLASGALTLKLTLLSRGGQLLAMAEREIIVDHSTYTTIPVELVLQDQDIPVPAGVTVRGASWIYMWRSRHALAHSSAEGYADLSVEALSQGPVEYLVEVEPTVVDGVLYEGLDNARVTIEAGAQFVEPMTLTVSATRGDISGHVVPSEAAPASIWAVCREDGRSIKTAIGGDGSFHFEDVPLDRYHLVLDNQRLAADGYVQTANSLPVDLIANAREELTIRLAAVPPEIYSGRVYGVEDNLLPFAWMTTADGDRTFTVLPATSEFFWPAAPAGRTSVILQAPGYYSRAAIVNSAGAATDSFTLALHPETVLLPWGEGALVLPSDSDVEQTAETIDLQRGWLWGSGVAEKPFAIRTGSHQLTIQSGSFALEYLPPQRAWFYLFDGEAQLVTGSRTQSLKVSEGQMVNLLNGGELVAVTYDPVVVGALQQGTGVPIIQRWEPTLVARVRDGIARTGTGVAQIVTFVTYILVCISIVVVPAYILYLRAIRRKHLTQ